MIQSHLEARGDSLVTGDYDDTRAQFCVCKTGYVDSRDLI